MDSFRYATDEEIIEGVVAWGGYSQYATEGLDLRTDSALRKYISAHPKLKDKIEQARAKDLVGRRPNREDHLEQRVKELETELRKRHKEDVSDTRVVDLISRNLDSLVPIYEPPKARKSLDTEEHEFILLFSDTHAAEVVSQEETMGMNEYNWEIMLQRMAKIQDKVLSYQANRPYPISKLNIFNLGDMLSGDIHEELKVTNDRPMAEATVQFGLDNARFIEEFVPHFQSIYVHGVPGNHPRASQKPSAKHGHNNADWVSYKISEIALQGYPSVNFSIPKSNFGWAQVAGYNFLLMHGDGVRSTMPGVPFGGVTRRVTTLQQQFASVGKKIDYVTMGHFHQVTSLEGVGTNTFINGSVKGVDEYSLKQFGSGRKPTQILLTVHPRHGVSDMSFLDLED